MTVLDFFQNQCAEAPQSNSKFYIVDDRNQTPAYTTTERIDEKITEVENPNGKNIVFTPIDHCLITGNNPKRCDGMLTGENFLFLVEIKDRKRKRFAAAKREAKEQLTQTIALLAKPIPIWIIYSLNKKHTFPLFAYRDSSEISNIPKKKNLKKKPVLFLSSTPGL